jgi:hypothetical protein
MKNFLWGAERSVWKFMLSDEYVFIFLGRNHQWKLSLSFERGGNTWRYPRLEAWTSDGNHCFRFGWLKSAFGFIWWNE